MSRSRILDHAALLAFIVPAIASSQVAHAADTVYKSVDSTGRVVYSDSPPAQGKVEKQMTFEHMPSSPLPEAVLRYRRELQKGIADSGAVAAPDRVRIFTAPWCGYCKQAKAYLNAKGIPFQEDDIETPNGGRAFARAGMGTGIPLLIYQGQHLQGFSRAGYDALFGSASR